jgi:hypothetical protein
MHINYSIFQQHYEEKMQVGLPILRQHILLQLGERFNVHLFQDSVTCAMKDKP